MFLKTGLKFVLIYGLKILCFCVDPTSIFIELVLVARNAEHMTTDQ